MTKVFQDKALFWILVGAFVIRVFGIWYGLPSLYNSDEPTIVSQALSFGAKKSLEPGFVEYPTFYFYFLFFVYGLYFGVGWLFGFFNSALDFGASFFLDPSGLFLLGRLVSVILGTLAVLMVFRLGNRYFSRTVGVFAALMLALSFTHVVRSHWVLIEAALSLICALALYLILRYFRNPDLKTNFLAGLVAGLAISTKYNAGFIFLPLLIASIFVYKGNIAKLGRALSVSMASLLIGFLIGSPYWILSFSDFFDASIKYTFSHVTYGVVGHITNTPILWPFWGLVSQEWIVGFLLLSGFIYSFWSKEKKQILLLSFAVPTFLYIGTWRSADVHYLIPMYPALAILAAVFLKSILTQIRDSKLKILFVAILIVPSLAKIAYFDISLAHKDTRNLAEGWIESNIPSGSVIGYENYVYGPNLFDPSRFFKNEAQSQFLPLELRERLIAESLRRTSYRLFNLRKDVPRMNLTGTSKVTNPYFRRLLRNRLPSLSTLQKLGVEFLMVSSDSYGHYFSETSPEKGSLIWFSYQNGRTFYKSVFDSGMLTLISEFKPGFWNPGPTIKIYKFNGTSAN